MCAALAAPVTPAYAQDSACAGGGVICLVVVPDSGSNPDTKTIGADDPCLTTDVRNVTYEVRDSSGRRSDTDAVTGTSMRTFLEQCGEGILDRATYVTVNLPTGNDRGTYLATLDKRKGDLEATSRFERGLFPAVYFDGANPAYVRPLRSADDVNNRDNFEDPNYLTVTVHTNGQVLHPTIANHGTSHPSATDGVRLDADVPDADPNVDLTYSWFFGDGSDAEQTSEPFVRHRFGTATGSYRPVVTVTGSDTSYGQSAPLATPIVVGTPPHTSAAPTGAGGRGRTTAPDNGPATGPDASAPAAPRGSNAAGSGTATAAGSGAPVNVPARADPAATGGAVVNGFLLAGAGGFGPRGRTSSTRAAVPAARTASTGASGLTSLWWLLVLVMPVVGVLTERRRPHRPERAHS